MVVKHSWLNVHQELHPDFETWDVYCLVIISMNLAETLSNFIRFSIVDDKSEGLPV